MTFKDILRCQTCRQLMWWTKDDSTGIKSYYCNTCKHMPKTCEGDCDVCSAEECSSRTCELSNEAMLA